MADRYWKWGYFYCNYPEDSALVVPARAGIGFSYNYAQSVRAVGERGGCPTVTNLQRWCSFFGCEVAPHIKGLTLKDLFCGKFERT